MNSQKCLTNVVVTLVKIKKKLTSVMKYPISCRFCRFSSLSAGDRQQQPASVRLNFFVTCCFPRLLLLLPASVQKSPGKVLSSCLCCFDHQEQSVRGVTLTDWTDISTTEVVPGTFIPRAFIPILFPVTLQGMRQHGCSRCRGCKNPQIFGTSHFAPADFEAFSTNVCPT